MVTLEVPLVVQVTPHWELLVQNFTHMCLLNFSIFSCLSYKNISEVVHHGCWVACSDHIYRVWLNANVLDSAYPGICLSVENVEVQILTQCEIDPPFHRKEKFQALLNHRHTPLWHTWWCVHVFFMHKWQFVFPMMGGKCEPQWSDVLICVFDTTFYCWYD